MAEFIKLQCAAPVLVILWATTDSFQDMNADQVLLEGMLNAWRY